MICIFLNVMIFSGRCNLFQVLPTPSGFCDIYRGFLALAANFRNSRHSVVSCDAADG